MAWTAPISIRDPYPQVYCVGKDRTTSISAVRDRDPVPMNAEGGTFSLLAPGGAVLVDAVAVTVADNEATVTISAEVLHDTLQRGGQYVERWSDLWDERSHPVDREVALSLTDLYPVITDDDILRRYPTIDRHRGTVISSYQPFIDDAWGELIRELTSRGVFVSAVLSPTALADAHRELACALIMAAFAIGQGADNTRWTDARDTHRAAYERALKKATWRSDHDLDGIPDGDRREGRPGTIHVNTAPAGSFGTRWRGRWRGGR